MTVDDLEAVVVAGEVGGGSHRGDTAVPDGNGSVVDGPEPVVQRDDGGAGDDNVSRFAGAHVDDSDRVEGEVVGHAEENEQGGQPGTVRGPEHDFTVRAFASRFPAARTFLYSPRV